MGHALIVGGLCPARGIVLGVRVRFRGFVVLDRIFSGGADRSHTSPHQTSPNKNPTLSPTQH